MVSTFKKRFAEDFIPEIEFLKHDILETTLVGGFNFYKCSFDNASEPGHVNV